MPDTLRVNENLAPGQGLQSQNGFYSLIMQQDGNLVLYEPNAKVRWAAGSNHGPGRGLFLQGDGNLVVRREDWSAAFNAGVAGYPGADKASLVMQNDGNLVLYSGARAAQWHTHTWIRIEDGRVYKTPNDPRVFVIEGGKRRHIPDPYTLERGYGGWGKVEVIPPDQMDRIPEGSPVRALKPATDAIIPPAATTSPSGGGAGVPAQPDVKVEIADVRLVVSLTTKGLNDVIARSTDTLGVAQTIVNAIAVSGEPVTATIKAAVDAAALFIKVSTGILRALDRGNGVYITVFWPAAIFLQFFVLPTSR